MERGEPGSLVGAKSRLEPAMYRSLFSSALTSHWRREVLRTSLWFVPSL
jgi:hypothetical protein